MNEKLFFYIYNFSHRWDFLDQLVAFTAEIFPYIVCGMAFVFLLWHHDVFDSQNPLRQFAARWKEIIFVFASSGFAWVIAKALKASFHTDRPPLVFEEVKALIVDESYAFPSGHATLFTALAVAIFMHHKKTGYLFMFFALVISLARVAAGVHFPIDILGGAVLGALISYFLNRPKSLQYKQE